VDTEWTLDTGLICPYSRGVDPYGTGGTDDVSVRLSVRLSVTFVPMRHGGSCLPRILPNYYSKFFSTVQHIFLTARCVV